MVALVVRSLAKAGPRGRGRDIRPFSASQHYRIFVQSGEALGSEDAMPATPFAMNVQHAKWSHDGKQLVFAAGFPVGGAGIAIAELA
jgi:hypothetical protein